MFLKCKEEIRLLLRLKGMCSPGTTATVHSLYIYPVKGCSGQAVKAVNVTETGFALDRHWMVVSTAKMKGIYQIPEKKMALIEARLPEAALLGDWKTLPPDVAFLTLQAPSMTPLKIALHSEVGAGKRVVESSIWEWKGATLDEGDAAAAWLSEFLSKDVRLVRYLGDSTEPGMSDAAAERPVAVKWVPEKRRILTSFDYGFQFLLISKDSLDGLHEKMGLELPEDRWRANIVISGAGAWREDLWESVAISGSQASSSIKFESVRPCDRCKVTATDQKTLEQAEEPLATLKTFRKGEHLGIDSPPSLKSAVFFGWYLLALDEGRVSIGDTVKAIKLRHNVAEFSNRAPKVSQVSARSFEAIAQWLLAIVMQFIATLRSLFPKKWIVHAE